MPPSMTPRVVFLDANVLVGKGWDHPLLQRFIDLVQAGLVLPVTTDLTKTEIAKVLAEKDFSSISQLAQPRARRLAQQLFSVALPEIEANALREALIRTHLARTEAFFDEIGAIESAIDTVKPSVVMAAYAGRTGVFAEGAKKQQFNDACILEALRPLANQDGLIIVSADTDFQVAVKGERHMRALKSLPELFDELGLKSDRTMDVREFLAHRQKATIAAANNALHEIGLRSCDLPGARLTGFQVTGVSFPTVRSFRTRDGEGIFVSATAKLELNVRYLFPDYDVESGKADPDGQWFTVSDAAKDTAIFAPCTLVLRTDKAGEPVELGGFYFDDDHFALVSLSPN